VARVLTAARPIAVVLLVLVVLLALLWLGQRRLIYFPDPAAAPPAAQALPGARDVTLETSDGLRLGAWLVPARAPDLAVAVLVAPGNAGSRLGRAPFAAALARAGLAVLLMDYRGYGGNPGSPTERGLARDIRAGYRLLTEQAGYPPERIVFFGESLGAAVVADLATAHPPAGLVLRSPFTDLAAAGAAHYPFLPVRLLLRDRFRLADAIARVDVPTVVVYGTADSVVPPEQSRAVGARAAGPGPGVVVDGADHNDAALFTGGQVIGAVVDLAGRITGRR